MLVVAPRVNDRVAIDADKPLRNEEWISLADSGQRILLDTTKTRIFLNGDKHLGVLGIGHDITEQKRSEKALRNSEKQKRSEKALRNSEKRFRALFEQAGGYFMILDPNTTDGIPVIIDANAAACATHGYTREEFIGRPVADIDDADGKRLVKARTAEIMAGLPFYVENTHVRKDGSTFTVAVNAQRIDIEESPPLIFTMEYDITERRRVEEQLRYRDFLLAEMERIAHVGGWEFDPVTGTGTWTEEVARIHGLDPAEKTDLENGSGYPKGLKAGEIILEARILAVADVVEAISSHRPYRPALGLGVAMEEIMKGRGSIYDSEVVDAARTLLTQKDFTF